MRFGSDYTQDLTQFTYLPYTFDGPQVCENNFLGPGNKHIPVGKKGGRGNKKMTMGRR